MEGVPRAIALVGLMAAWAVGCGGSDAPRPAPTPVADPSLAREAPGKREILIRGELSPASHGPYQFAGRYRVAFEQYAPEDLELDFTEQTSFEATLDRRAEIQDRESVRLFKVSRRTGRKRLAIRGRYFVGVSFGDFPYVIRFTPLP